MNIVNRRVDDRCVVEPPHRDRAPQKCHVQGRTGRPRRLARSLAV